MTVEPSPAPHGPACPTGLPARARQLHPMGDGCFLCLPPRHRLSQSLTILAPASPLVVGGQDPRLVDPKVFSEFAPHKLSALMQIIKKFQRGALPCLGAHSKMSKHPSWAWLVGLPASVQSPVHSPPLVSSWCSPLYSVPNTPSLPTAPSSSPSSFLTPRVDSSPLGPEACTV